MEKKIIVEVKRLQELMGVKKNILTEDRILGKVADFVKRVLDGVESTIPKTVTRIGNRNADEFTLPDGKVVRLLDNEVSDIRNAIRLGKGLNTLTDNAKSVLRQILKSTGNLNPKKLYDDYVDEIIAQQGDEEKFFKALNRRLKEIDPTTRTTPTLKKVLQSEYFPDDQDFVDEILPYLDSKLDDYNTGLLVNRGGKLVREISPDIDDFVKNIIPLSKDEIDKISKSSWISNLSTWFKNSEKLVDDIKRLMKTLESGNLKIAEKQKVENAILDKMNVIYNWKSESEKYLEGFIKELGNSQDKSLIELKKKLEELKPTQGWQVARQVLEEYSWGQKRWEAFSNAFKQTMSLEKGIYKLIRLDKAWKKFSDKFRMLFSDTAAEMAEKTKTVETGNILNVIKTGSRRGFPKFSEVIDAEGNIKPDFYSDLRKIGKNQLAWESYGWEWFMRTLKWKFYFAFLETLIPALFLKWGITKDEHNCALSLSEMMKKRNITASEDIVSLISDGQINIFPECIQTMIKNDERRKLSYVILLADYITSPGSSLGNYFIPQLKESFLQFSGLGNISTIFPGFLDDVLVTLYKDVPKYIKLYDTTGVNIRNDNQNDTRDNPSPSELPILEENEISFRAWCLAMRNVEFQSWDNVNKVGIAKNGVKYKLNSNKTSFDPINGETVVDSKVQELYNQYPFLRENNSTITVNSDGTFNERFPDGVNLTILIKDGVAYYSAYNGTPYPEPLPKVEKQ